MYILHGIVKSIDQAKVTLVSFVEKWHYPRQNLYAEKNLSTKKEASREGPWLSVTHGDKAREKGAGATTEKRPKIRCSEKSEISGEGAICFRRSSV